MSLILKGIDLPTNGETLIVGIYGNGLVSVEHSKSLALAIEINAEAIQIPKGHGRLIDADKYQYPGDLEYEPTILESEGNDEFDIERD